MNREEEFKKELKNILASKEFVFDEANWQGAAALIDAARRRKRRIFYFILPAFLFFIGGGAYLYFSADENGATTPVLAVKELKSLPAEKPLLAEKPATMANAPSTQATASQPAEKPAPIAKKEKPIDTHTSPLENTAPAAAQPQSQANAPVVVKNTPPAATTKPLNPVTIITQPPVEAPIVASVPGQIKENNTTEPLVNVPSQGTNQTKVANEEAQAPANTIAAEQPAAVANEPTSVPATQSSVPVAALPVQPVELSSINRAETVAVELPPVAAANETTTAVTPTIPVASKADTAGTEAIKQPVTDNTKNQIFAEAGLAYTMGWKNPDKTDARGFNPVLGILISNSVTKNISVALGVQYNSVSNLSYSSRVSKITHYSLGEESRVTVITPVKLHYISIPIKVGYALNQNNIIGLGYNLAYLVNVSAKVETYQEGFNGIQNYKSEKTLGYKDGFKTYDLQLSLYYRARLINNFWFNAELIYGVNDLKNDDFFKSKLVERSSGLKLSLLYNFYRK